MRAVEITQAGGPEVLALTDRPMPKPKAGEVLIKVHYAGVNRPDALQRAGLYRAPADASDLPGLECSGTIEALGEGVSEIAVGDTVCALLPGGGYAEYVTTPAAHVLPVPSGVSLQDAAGLCETLFTVWSNVVERGKLTAGETVLIHAGGSGIGITAIQLAKALGATVIATSRSAEKCARCLELGADYALNTKEVDFLAEVKALGGVDVILDMVGADYMVQNIKALREEGRLVQIAFLTGSKVEMNFAQIMLKRLTITGSTLRPQSDVAKTKIAQALKQKVWPLIEAGKIVPLTDRIFDLSQAGEAHGYMESNAHVGKILLKVQ